MSPDKRCRWCTYWDVYQFLLPPRPEEGDLRQLMSGGYERRECRKRSPTYDYVAGRSARWPETSSSEWCGDFEHYKT